MLVSPCLPPKVAKNIKLQGIRWSLRAIEGLLTILPLPNQINIFLSYKRGLGVSFDKKIKRIRKIYQNPFPFLAQVLHPILSFGLKIPPPGLFYLYNHFSFPK
jgi:hypothetical protein